MSLFRHGLAALLLVSGCAARQTPCIGSPPLELHASGAFTSFERAALLEAATEWEYTVRATISIAFDDGGTLLRAQSEDIAAEDKRMGSKALGLTYTTPGLSPVVVLVSDRITQPRTFYGVAVHEIGHALGVPHTPGGVMQEYFSEELIHVTPIDAVAYWVRWCPTTKGLSR